MALEGRIGTEGHYLMMAQECEGEEGKRSERVGKRSLKLRRMADSGKVIANNRRMEGKSGMRLEGPVIATRTEREGSISILRDEKFKFDRTTVLVGGGSAVSKVD
jgi:hypothetical protein